MVLSNIDNTITYIDSKNIDKNDIDYESYIYKGKIYNKDIKFVLGNPNFQYRDNNIVYLNIYLYTKFNYGVHITAVHFLVLSLCSFLTRFYCTPFWNQHKKATQNDR